MKGDAIALPFGVVAWWLNPNDTELVVLFLGDTSKGHKAGQFTNFPITDTNGIFSGFSTEFVSRAWDLTEDEAKNLVSSQTNSGIVKVKDGQAMPEPSPEDREGIVLNCEEASASRRGHQERWMRCSSDLVRIKSSPGRTGWPWG